MNSEQIQILDILYPDGIKKEHYSKLSVILNKIDNLINESKEVIIKSEALEEFEQKTKDEVKKIIEDNKTNPINNFPVFIEVNSKDAPLFSKAQRVEYRDMHLLKQSLYYKAVGRDRTTIIAKLDYLKDYYDKLPNRFSMDKLEGLSRDKQRILYRLYLNNTNFKNHEEIDKSKKFIVKD